MTSTNDCKIPLEQHNYYKFPSLIEKAKNNEL